MDLNARLPCPSQTSSLLKLMSIELVMPSNHLVLCCPLLLLPSIFPSIRVFANKSVLYIRWPKHWSFSFSISPSNEYSGQISLRIDWLISLQSKALSRIFSSTTVLQSSAFFMVRFSHRSPGGGKGYPLQYSGLEDPMDCTVHEATKSWA